MVPKAEIWNDRIRIEANFTDKDLSMQVPGARWDRTELFCHVPKTWASCKQLRGIFGDRLEIGYNLSKWAFEEIKDRINPCMVLRDCLDLFDRGNLDPRLYGYQVAGAQFLVAARHGLLSDPPGAGKSCTAISAARLLNSLPALVVAPKSTLIGWQREVETWWPGIPVYVVDGTKKKRQETILQCNDKPGFVIIGWEALRRHTRLAPYGSRRLSEEQRTLKELNNVPFRLVIGDEVHRAAGISLQTLALWAVGDMPSVEYRWGLTGTPMTKQLDTLWAILRFLNKDEHPSRVAFVDRYCQTRPVPWGSGLEVIGPNPANEEEFQKIFQPRFRRMPKEVILSQLPPIVRTKRYIEMSPSQRRCYEQMAEDMMTETESGELLIAMNPAVKMLRMIQFSSAAVNMVPQEDGELVARLIDPSNKLDALMEDLPDLLEAGESIIVFAVSRQLIEMAGTRLQKAKINYSVIKGGQAASDRQSQIDAFQNSKVPVVLVVISAGGTGLNLYQGRIMIFLQRAWDFVSNHQAEGRAHRIGSEIHNQIEIIDYVSRNTVDEHVIQVSEGKEIHLEEIVRDRESVSRMLHGQ